MPYRTRIFMIILYLIGTLLLTFCQSERGRILDGQEAEDSQRADFQQVNIKVGAQQLLENQLEGLKGQNIGLVMNPTARVNGVHVLDTLMALGMPVKALFAAEHGFRGDQGAGEIIQDGQDEETGLRLAHLV